MKLTSKFVFMYSLSTQNTPSESVIVVNMRVLLPRFIVTCTEAPSRGSFVCWSTTRPFSTSADARMAIDSRGIRMSSVFFIFKLLFTVSAVNRSSANNNGSVLASSIAACWFLTLFFFSSAMGNYGSACERILLLSIYKKKS